MNSKFLGKVAPWRLIMFVMIMHGTVLSQIDPKYRQLELGATGVGDDYTFRQMTSQDDSGSVLVYPNKKNFYSISIPHRTATELPTPEILQHSDFLRARRHGSGVFGYLYSTEARGFTWDPIEGMVYREMPPAANQLACLSEDGPFVDPGSDMYSIDRGINWVKQGRSISNADWDSPTGLLLVTPTNAVNRVMVMTSQEPDTLYPAWSRLQFSPIMIRRYVSDSLIALTRSALYVGSFSDSTFTQIDTMTVAGARRPLMPLYIETLDDNSVLYCDRRGWCGVIRGFHIDSVHEIAVNGLFDYLLHTKSTAYWIEPLADSVIVYKVTLTSPPIFQRSSLPAEFRFMHPLEYSRYPTCFGEYGFVLCLQGMPDYIVDTHQSNATVLMTGSLIARTVSFLRDRRMIYAWKDVSQALHVLDDLGNAISADSAGIGVLTHPFAVFSTDDPAFRNGRLQRHRGWRETGTPLPTQWNSSMVFPGPVIRRFSLDGRLLDTLVRVPVCFASTIDDSILATGGKGVVRLQTATRFDTTLLASASNITADTIGYPSSMTRARDGALILTVLGTSFLHRDSAASVSRRWGGILRSTNDGKSWTTVSVPSTGSYIMHCTRTTSGALIASTMLMVEDSTHPVDVNAPESYYTASNIELMRSSDNGMTWSVTGTAFYAGPFQPCTGNFIETAPGMLYAATLASVMISSDDGRTWSADEQLPVTAQPASVSRGADGVLVATTQGVYEIRTTTSVRDDKDEHQCRPVAMTRAALRQFMQQHTIRQLLLCDITGRTSTLTQTSDLAALPAGLYTILTCDIAAVPTAVLLVE